MTSFTTTAGEIALKWGPAFTKLVMDKDDSDFLNMFDKAEAVAVVLQTADGTEAAFSIGDVEGADLTWAEFNEQSTKDLEAQNYVKTVAECLGVLGDRLILETGRINKDGEIYTSSYSLLTMNEAGKIIMFEAFTDIQGAGLIAAGTAGK